MGKIVDPAVKSFPSYPKFGGRHLSFSDWADMGKWSEWGICSGFGGPFKVAAV